MNSDIRKSASSQLPQCTFSISPRYSVNKFENWKGHLAYEWFSLGFFYGGQFLFCKKATKSLILDKVCCSTLPLQYQIALYQRL